ncbi:protein adenylyltransferase SelO [Lichenicoccus sp.]|uniref:protein adenylyltransferase SelO n=1 Tax=Lichenicoccus sp. TaxID=2781899 RepID=UPI003D10F749
MPDYAFPNDAFIGASDGAQPAPATFRFVNIYARLPERFFARLDPTPVATPQLVCLNDALAVELGLDPQRLASAEGVLELAGTRVPDGAEPLAMAYAGHQFGNFVPQLGDGRALLLGEVIDRAGERRDIQLKGAGPTPFSRRGDGRAALGPALREFIVSEAMAALGIPTTRSLAVVATGETIMRERPLPGAVLTRVARSHVRVGTFQYFAVRRDTEGLRVLADHVIARHYPQAAEAGAAIQPYRVLLDAVIARTARLIADWQSVGFIHGVMNTDNMSVAGETIDYGPCAFMDSFHPGTVFSSIDAGGRYAYGNQPQIAHWNMARLAEAMLPLLDPDPSVSVAVANEALARFAELFQTAWDDAFRRKLGLATPQEGDRALAHDLLTCMAAQEADFTLTFRRLCDVRPEDVGPEDAPGPQARPEPPEASLRHLFADPACLDSWLQAWGRRLAAEDTAPADRRRSMRAANPAFIARNHRVEASLAAAEAGDRGPLDELLSVLRRPFDDQPDRERYAAPPRPEEVVRATYCGT